MYVSTLSCIVSERNYAGDDYISFLIQLSYLNLGGNSLSDIPDCLAAMTNLAKLHLFRNRIAQVPHDLLGRCIKITI